MFDREHYNQSGLYGVYGATRNIMTSFKYNF
jgi:outer membrane receptor for ferric coprogen and ferric-rhodotorulic acid